jgi:hypothetical protein
VGLMREPSTRNLRSPWPNNCCFEMPVAFDSLDFDVGILIRRGGFFHRHRPRAVVTSHVATPRLKRAAA